MSSRSCMKTKNLQQSGNRNVYAFLRFLGSSCETVFEVRWLNFNGAWWRSKGHQGLTQQCSSKFIETDKKYLDKVKVWSLALSLTRQSRQDIKDVVGCFYCVYYKEDYLDYRRKSGNCYRVSVLGIYLSEWNRKNFHVIKTSHGQHRIEYRTLEIIVHWEYKMLGDYRNLRTQDPGGL